MTDLLTSAQMRAIETAAMASGRVTGLQLMDRAGRGAVDAIRAEWPDLHAGRAVVLAGPGNNGGDGYVVARRLRDLGWRVELYALGDPAQLTGDAARMFALWADEVAPLAQVGQGGPVDLVVDALFGTGLTRPVAAEVLAAVSAACRRGDSARLVALDCLSGLDADTGHVLAEGAEGPRPADLTVTFHAAKLGHYLGDGPALTGPLRTVPIGLDVGCDGAVQLVSGPLMPLGKAGAAHKYDHGHAVVLSGPATRTGAARLAARAALRVGAGLVTLAAPTDALAECAAQLTAIMLVKADMPADLSALLEDPRLNAMCLGPGLGVDRAPDFVRAACAAPGTPAVVLDADALTGFAEAPDTLFALCRAAGPVVMTPHMGEFGRLFADLAADETLSKVDRARQAAARSGAVLLLKGADTVIAAPDGRAALVASTGASAAPWLATAGTGDVLAGLVTGLQARGMPAFEAAATAAWLHRDAARRFGPGLIAEDLPDAVPLALRALGD